MSATISRLLIHTPRPAETAAVIAALADTPAPEPEDYVIRSGLTVPRWSIPLDAAGTQRIEVGEGDISNRAMTLAVPDVAAAVARAAAAGAAVSTGHTIRPSVVGIGELSIEVRAA